MKNEEVKNSKSKGAKILGVIGIVALIAYNGWVVFNNHLGSGSVRGTVKELLIENIPNCINDEIVKFVELDDVKLDGIADDKWDGVAMAKLEAKETGKIDSVKFTFDVEKKGSMVYINNLMLDEGSAESLLTEKSTGSQKGKVAKGASKPKITDWTSYIKDWDVKVEQMTSVQQKELRESEVGRPAEIIVTVDDVSENSEDGESAYVISSKALGEKWVNIWVYNTENTRDAYAKVKSLHKNSKIKVAGVVFFLEFNELTLGLSPAPQIACLQLTVETKDALSLDKQYDEVLLKMVKIMKDVDPKSVPDQNAIEKEQKKFRSLTIKDKEKELAQMREDLAGMESKSREEVVTMMQSSDETDMAFRARSLYAGIAQANTEREGVGLPSVWPKSNGMLDDDKEDVAGIKFESATSYFLTLFDRVHKGENAYVDTLIEKYAFEKSGKKSAWLIAKGVNDKLSDNVPVLVSSNVDASSLIVKAGTYEAKGLQGTLKFLGNFAILVYKNGKVSVIKSGNSGMSNVYQNQDFVIPNGFSYLVP